jgi:hypothetical protein
MLRRTSKRPLISFDSNFGQIPSNLRRIAVFRVITDEIDLATAPGLSLKQSKMIRQLGVAGARSYNNEHLQ